MDLPCSVWARNFSRSPVSALSMQSLRWNSPPDMLTPNGLRLDQHLALYEQGTLGEQRQSPRHHALMEVYLGETNRLTHDLLAAVKTAVDHTRNVLRTNWSEDHPIRTDFETAKCTFVTDGQLVVVQDLRNYFLHRARPTIEADRMERRRWLDSQD